MDKKSKFIWKGLHLHSCELQVRFNHSFSSLIVSFCIQVLISVNYGSLHWSLIVICHPGEVVNFNGEVSVCDISFELYFSKNYVMIHMHISDKESGNSLKVPCILHMDSIKGNHSGLKNLLQRYIRISHFLVFFFFAKPFPLPPKNCFYVLFQKVSM
jgi:hypothetical protein